LENFFSLAGEPVSPFWHPMISWPSKLGQDEVPMSVVKDFRYTCQQDQE
jgi:hypothetical protein